MKRWLRIARVGVLLLLVAGFFALLPTLDELRARELLDYTPLRPVRAALLLIAVHCLKSVVMVIPVMALYICSGILFPPVWALLVTYTGMLLEVSIGYLLGRRLGREAVEGLTSKSARASRLLKLDGGNDAVAVVVARISPMNCDLVSMLFGSLNMPYGRYAACSLLGASPTMVPYVLAGGALDNIWSAQFLVPFGLCLAAAGLTLGIHMHRQRRQAVSR